MVEREHSNGTLRARARAQPPRACNRAARAAGAAGATLLTATLAGCFTASDLRAGPQGFGQPVVLASDDGGRLDGNELALYLATMQALVADDPVLQADAFRAVAIAAEADPTTSSQLNLALALATPGHPSSDAAAAQTLLSELLASGSALLPEERILAMDHLKQVEQRLILDAEARELRDQLTAARSARNAQNTRQVESLQAENERLRAELAEAREKLDAITNIERSIRERENGANVQ
jgi:hypothetical protein